MLTIEQKSKFLNLAGQLSPENLTCDGELPRSQVNAKLKKLKAQWAALEKEVGFSVDEGEVWNWIDEIRIYENAQRDMRIAATPSHPLLDCKNPGVWSRLGANGMSAYYIQNDSFRGPVMFNGVDLMGNATNEYRLYSEFAQVLNRKEQIGTYATLEEAVDAAEAFLKTVTRESYRAARPQYREENIDRELRRLPA